MNRKKNPNWENCFSALTRTHLVLVTGQQVQDIEILLAAMAKDGWTITRGSDLATWHHTEVEAEISAIVDRATKGDKIVFYSQIWEHFKFFSESPILWQRRDREDQFFMLMRFRRFKDQTSLDGFNLSDFFTATKHGLDFR